MSPGGRTRRKGGARATTDRPRIRREEAALRSFFLDDSGRLGRSVYESSIHSLGDISRMRGDAGGRVRQSRKPARIWCAGKRVRGVQERKFGVGWWSEGGSWAITGRNGLGFRVLLFVLCCGLGISEVAVVDLDGRSDEFDTVTVRREFSGKELSWLTLVKTTGRVSVGSRAMSVTSGIRIGHT